MPNLLHNRPGIQYSPVSINVSGFSIVVAAHSQRRIRLFAAHLANSLTNIMQWGSSQTLLSGTQNLGVNQSINLDYNPLGWFDAASQEALTISLIATPTGGFGGHITWAYVG